MEYQEQAYYDEVTKRMVDGGLTFLGQAQISTDDLTYFVHCKKARNTTLVFHVLDKNCVIALNHSECDSGDPDDISTNYWRMETSMDFGNEDQVHKAFMQPCVQCDVDDEMYEPALIEYQPTYKGFANYGAYRSQTHFEWTPEENKTDATVTTPEVLCNAILEVVNQLKPYFSQAPFKHFITNWAPTYTFSGNHRNYQQRQDAEQLCRDVFWKRFGTKREELINILGEI